MTLADRRLLLGVVVAGLALPTAKLAHAEPAPPNVDTEPAPARPPLDVKLFASTSYGYNFNRPTSQQNAMRVFDTNANTAQVDVLELVLVRAASAPGSAGVRVDLTAGSAIPHVEASAGLFRDEMGVAGDFDIQQVFASYIAELGSGLRFDVGKFVTHMGYEVIEGYDGYNDNYSRSMLFGYTIPFTHTGLRVSTALGPKLVGTLLVVNGWDNVKDNNARPSLGVQLAVAPTRELAIAVNYIGGPEGERNGALRHVGNVVATFHPVPTWSFALDAVAGHERAAIDVDGDLRGDRAARWLGAAAYAKVVPSTRLALTLRGELLADLEGARTGAAQRLLGVTLTPAWRLHAAFVVRGDLRLDRSDARVFLTDRDGEARGTQLTAAINLVVVYD